MFFFLKPFWAAPSCFTVNKFHPAVPERHSHSFLCIRTKSTARQREEPEFTHETKGNSCCFQPSLSFISVLFIHVPAHSGHSEWVRALSSQQLPVVDGSQLGASRMEEQAFTLLSSQVVTVVNSSPGQPIVQTGARLLPQIFAEGGKHSESRMKEGKCSMLKIMRAFSHPLLLLWVHCYLLCIREGVYTPHLL